MRAMIARKEHVMYTEQQIVKMKKTQKRTPFRNLDGQHNLVARVRSTPKGRRLMRDGKPVGSKGLDGRRLYVIREAKHGCHSTGMDLYCSCPAQKFHAHYGHPCKHILLLLEQFAWMQVEGVVETKSVIIYEPDAIVRAEAVIHPQVVVSTAQTA